MDRRHTGEDQSIYAELMQGLQESLAHARGELTLKTTTLPAPAPALSRKRVVAIRKRAGMSQAVFACFLNVPKATLQSWEQGARKPKAGEARLLQIMEAAPKEFEALVIAVGENSGKGKRRKRLSAA